jgi:adenylate cyclase
MTTNDMDSPARTRAKRLSFDRFVLDLDRGCLLLDGSEIAVRPKTFAVLCYLVENSGRLVTKDELFAEAWPGLAVTDDALVQSIGELRRGLGDDGSRLIKTIPRRGYRFEAAVSTIARANLSVSGTAPDLETSRDDDRASKSFIRPHAWKLLTTAVSGWRGGLFAALAIVGLLAAGALLVDRSGWKFPGTLSLSGEQFSKPAEVNAKPAIAILPFVNRSDDSAREYFVDGLTQDIINALGRFPDLTVMSWNAVFPYKGRPANPAEIAHNLAVRYQIEGNVRQTGDRLRVNAQLVDTNGQVLWSASFDEALADVFSLQDKITTQIAGTLAIRVSQAEQRRVIAKPTKNLEAYDYVLRARPALSRPARANTVEARALLRRAIEIDPNYAAAYATLAETYFAAISMGWAESPTEFMSRAEAMANKALSLDESDVRAHIILGRIHIFYHRYEKAKAELDHAIAINPSDANALAGRGNILMWSGQTDAAIEILELAQRIDPELNPLDRMALSLAYYLKQRYDAAIEQAELNLRKTSGANFSRIVLAAAYAQLGRSEDAARVVATIHRVDPTFDAQEFGTKFLSAADLERLRDGLRKAGFSTEEAGRR